MTTSHLKTVITLGLLVLITANTTARCEEEKAGQFYLGVGIGIANVSDDAIFIDDSSSGYKALAGYHFNDYFSLEGTALVLDDFVAVNPFGANPVRAVADGNGINTSAVLRWPATSRIEVLVRAGVLFWQADGVVGDVDESGSDVSFGIGFGVKLTDALSARAEYDALQFGDVDVAVGTVTLAYRFGGKGE